MDNEAHGASTSLPSASRTNLDYYPNADMSVWLRTCHAEVTEPLVGHVSFGKVPPWLSGSLIRNGPGGVDIYGKGSCKHLFDGPGLLQKFHIQNGTASYSSRFIETKSFTRNVAAQRLLFSEFGTVATPDPCQTIFARIAAIFLGPMESNMSDNANISIHPFGDEVYSLSEFPFAHRINLENLKTIEMINVHEELGVINHSAHPHISGRKMYNIGQKLSLWLGPHYTICEMDTKPSGLDSKKKTSTFASTTSSVASSTTNLASYSLENSICIQSDSDRRPSSLSLGARSLGSESASPHFPSISKSKDQPKSPWTNARIVASIPSRWPLSLCYMHTFSITQSYFILIEQPLAIFLPTVPLNQISGSKSMSSCLKFYPEEDTVFHVISRHSKRSKTNKSKMSFRTSSFFFLHTINAYEMRDNETRETFVVVDICCYKDPSMIDCMYVDALKNAHSNPEYAKMFRGRPKRFLLKLDDFSRHRGSGLPGVESETLVDIGCETPKINDSYDGKSYNYFYAISSDVDRGNPGTLIKADVLRKTYDTWCETNAYPSEPIFVPRPNSQREDDGIVLSTVVYGGEDLKGPNRTSLIILNATSWDLIAKVDFSCESAIPKCLHGWYFPDDKTETQPRERSMSRQLSISKTKNMNLH